MRLHNALATIPEFGSLEAMLLHRRLTSQAIRVKHTNGMPPDGAYSVKFQDGTVCAVVVKSGFVVQVPNVVYLDGLSVPC